MNWKHICVEGYCSLEEGECIINKESVGIWCLDGKTKFCQHFSYCQASSSLILTNDDGEDIYCTAFDTDYSTNDKEDYKYKEKLWVESAKNNLVKFKESWKQVDYLDTMIRLKKEDD